MATRRGFLWGMAASLCAGQAWSQDLFGSSRPGGILLEHPPVNTLDNEALEALADHTLEGSWIQVLRTFGNPVLEGRFALRGRVETGQLCLAMWDLGDRVLGLGQFENQEPAVLWPVLETTTGRKPDIAIGDPSFVYTASQLETAHWRLSEELAARVGKPKQAAEVHGMRWSLPSRDIASRLEPMTRGLLPPMSKTPSHVVWHEPDPALPDVGDVGSSYTLGGGLPGLDTAMAVVARTGRMLAPLDGETAAQLFTRNGKAVYTPIQSPSGRSMGRVRILTI